MRRLCTLSDGFSRLGRRPRLGGTRQHRSPPGHRLARLEPLEARTMLSLGDLLQTLNNPGVGGGFGSSVAASGSTVVVGAPGSDVAYVFDAPTGDLLHTLSNPTATDDEFGASVAISGSTVVVGAPVWGERAVSAYIYDATTGDLLHTLSDLFVGPTIGMSVAVSGSTVAVGSADVPWVGIFDATTGNLLRALDPNCGFGGSCVAVSGSTVAVGAYVDPNGETTGPTYLYDADTGNLLRTLTYPEPQIYDMSEIWFDLSVAVSGSTVVVGVTLDDTGATNAGSAYVFDATTGDLLHTLNNPTPADNEWFGYSVAVSGSTVVVGATDAVYLFDAGTGELLSTLNVPGVSSVAASGNTLVVGTGDAAYVFDGDRTPRVDLLAVSDSGVTNGDNITNLDNSTGASTLQFGVPGTVPGATITIYADGTAIGSATATGTATIVTTDGTHDLADGTHTITARQTEPGQPESPDWPSMTLTVDTEAPSVPAAPDLQAASDTGVSNADNLTKDTTPTLDVSGSPYFRFYRDGVQTSRDYERGTTYTAPLQTEGTYSYAFIAIDRAGNESALSGALVVEIDTTAPAAPSAPDLQDASDTGLSQSDNITADSTPTFDIDPAAAPYFCFYGDGAKISGYETGTTYTAPVQLEGVHSYQVSAADAAGNESAKSTALSVTILSSVPSADVVDVTPDPRAIAVSSITVVFSRAVFGFELGDLTLRRDGGANLLTGSQTLTTADNITWTLGNLGGLTGEVGTYDLALTAAGSGITDIAGNALAANAADQWVRRLPSLGDLLHTLDDPGTTAQAWSGFGGRVAADGDLTVVSAVSADLRGLTDVGSAYVLNSTTGALVATLDNPTPATLDSFGSSVAVSGNTAVVGAPGDNTGAYRAGSAYIWGFANCELTL